MWKHSVPAAMAAAVREQAQGRLAAAPVWVEEEEREAHPSGVEEDGRVVPALAEVDAPVVQSCGVGGGTAWLAEEAEPKAFPVEGAADMRIAAAAGITLIATGEAAIGGLDSVGTDPGTAIMTAGMKTAIGSNAVAAGAPCATTDYLRPRRRSMSPPRFARPRNRLAVVRLLSSQGGDHDRFFCENSRTNSVAMAR